MSYAETLRDGARTLGLSLPDPLVEAMTTHFEILRKWAARMNITTVLDPDEAAILHGLDCLLLAECFEPEDTRRVLDVGSGGGFPGVVLALARPRLQMSLLEPQRKRASFLRVALTELRRPDVRVIEGRLEPVSAKKPSFATEVLVSRATIPPLELIDLAPAHLEPGGCLFLMSGAGAASAEVLEARAALQGLVHRQRLTHRLPAGQIRFIDRLDKLPPEHRESD